jgi:hypothetical protein
MLMSVRFGLKAEKRIKEQDTASSMALRQKKVNGAWSIDLVLNV